MISLLLTLALTLERIPPAAAAIVRTDAIDMAQASQRQRADQLFHQGHAAFDRHDYSQALDHWQLALDLYQALGATTQIAATLNALAATAIAMGDYPDAIASAQQGLPLAASRSDAMLQAQLLGNLGIAYQSLGRLADAVTTYRQTLALMREHDHRVGQAQTLSLLGNTYEAMGDYEAAWQAQAAGLSQLESLHHPGLEAMIRLNLSGLATLQQRYGVALAYAQDSIALSREAGDLATSAHGFNNLGVIYHRLGDWQRAQSFYRQGLDLARQTQDVKLQAEVLTNLGVMAEDQQALGQALDYHRRSVAIARSLAAPRLLAASLNNLAHAQLAQGATTTAEQSLREAIQHLTALRQGLEDTANIAVFNTQIYTYTLLMQVLVAQGRYGAALEASEQGRARALMDLLAPQAQASIDLETIQQTARDLNATLVEYALVPADNFIFQGHQRAPATHLYIWVVSPQGNITFHQQGLDTATLSLPTTVEQGRAAMGARGRNRSIQIVPTSSEASNVYLQELHQVLIAPIRAHLPSDPEQRVVFIPQEVLFYVPFAALQDSDGQYLIEHHTLLTAPAIHLLAATPTQPTDAQAATVVAGNPVMPTMPETSESPAQPLPPLPGAEQEAMAVAELLKTRPWLGVQATETALVPAMLDASIIHLATHGLLDYVERTSTGIPLPGAIALAPSETEDGLLTARELASLPLQADLVVLSACDTGLGEVTGDGIVGLSRSLIVAGARSAVVSLWAVPDTPTAQLMIHFYTTWLQGFDKAQALRRAMLKTMADYPHPRDWAAFTLVGAPD
ncbi:Tetratricopeptide repeat domain protein [Halomicronema hongdechloris C2206]|uniref:Tetratricopeptide repeat domain protein n=1 Tax=Halomicronema hongdechloris C2206 TaxID=1641165 RepID=A0A1Z3HHM1_9CYAN|nr:CHAT domain-containing protein [Halomicronema hongdechloris]ASC69707.1 Tetratricopeptide repeat domain protein [Halomicronema hongdechloris C2206]